MIYNFNVKLLAGGHDRVDSSWNRTVDGKDPFFKIYLPLEGSAILTIQDTQQPLQAGHIYFMSGWEIQQQACPEYMETLWLHFVPDSILLQHLLLHYGKFKKIQECDSRWIRESFRPIQEVFTPYDERAKKAPQVRNDVPDHTICRLKAVVLALISNILQEHEGEDSKEKTEQMQRLQRAIDFMDKSFLENPPLKSIAQQVHMAPNYFHKIFKETFGITPFEYMLNKRMSIAKELLGFSAKTIREIAEQAGYEDEFYFSKTFKKQTGISPARFRRRGI